jgi:hypothetical protein
MRQKESDVPASVCMVNTAIWVSMQYSTRLKWWARRDWILLLYQEVYRQQSRTHTLSRHTVGECLSAPVTASGIARRRTTTFRCDVG